jgi:hypothetical protein
MGYRLLAAALVALALVACGGHAAKKQQQSTAAETHWRSGIVSWSTSMTQAINGLSVLFSQPSSVRAIEGGEPRMAVKLRRLEDTLTGCAAAIQRLGDAPATFAAAHHEALRACAALQQGSALVRAGVRQIQHGLGFDLLTRSSDALASGQDSVRRVKLDLPPTTTG